MKIQYRIVLEIFILIMIYLALKGCNNPKPVIINNIKDTIVNDNIALNIVLENNKYLRSVNDSLIKLPPIYRIKYKAFYDTLITQAPDTCLHYLSQLNRKCMILDSVNKEVIKSDSILIASDLVVFSGYEKLNKSRIMQSFKDSLVIDSLTRSKNKFWKGFRIGFWTGAGTTQAVNSGVKFIK